MTSLRSAEYTLSPPTVTTGTPILTCFEKCNLLRNCPERKQRLGRKSYHPNHPVHSLSVRYSSMANPSCDYHEI